MSRPDFAPDQPGLADVDPTVPASGLLYAARFALQLEISGTSVNRLADKPLATTLPELDGFCTQQALNNYDASDISELLPTEAVKTWMKRHSNETEDHPMRRPDILRRHAGMAVWYANNANYLAVNGGIHYPQVLIAAKLRQAYLYTKGPLTAPIEDLLAVYGHVLDRPISKAMDTAARRR